MTYSLPSCNPLVCGSKKHIFYLVRCCTPAIFDDRTIYLCRQTKCCEDIYSYTSELFEMILQIRKTHLYNFEFSGNTSCFSSFEVITNNAAACIITYMISVSHIQNFKVINSLLFSNFTINDYCRRIRSFNFLISDTM